MTKKEYLLRFFVLNSESRLKNEKDYALMRLYMDLARKDGVTERSSLRGLTRTFGVSRTTVSSWIKKKVLNSPPLSTTLVAPDPEDPTSTILELDELWSFVLKKPTIPGCGLPSAVRRGKWSTTRLGTGVKKG
jgi:hypothetical protein